MMKLPLIILIYSLVFIGLANKLYGGVTVSSTAVGNWTTNAIWSPSTAPGVMNGGDDVTINSRKVTLNSNLTIPANTTLTVNGCDTLIINGDADFRNGSYLTVKACAVLIINGNVINRNNSNTIKIDGKIIISGSFTGGNGSALIGAGVMTIAGPVTLTGGTVFGSAVSCTVNCSSSAASPLPIELIDFSATCITNGVQLNWATASELNNDYFLIERSDNGIAWEQVAKVKGLTNSVITTEYVQVDYVSFDKLIYYRMTQVDVGGKATIFKIIDVNCGENSIKDQMILFPNPASSEVNLVFSVKNNSSNNKILLVNITGQIIFENTIDLTKGVNSFAFPIDLPNGSYTVLFTSDKLIIPAQKLMIVKP